ncbi:hypothetical protein FOVSG1_006983 [Fusarium oxysporum f. sp. vasinfectum]
MRIGFLGLGTMGTPMALNLRRQFPVTVWNRNGAKCTPLIEAGAKAAKTPSEVVEKSDVIFTMLFDSKAIQTMIDNEPDNGFMRAIRGKTLINTSSVPVAFSHKLAQQVQGAGGKFVEMPVSGSKGPAEQGQLVGMMAGDPEIAEQIRPVVEPITTATIYCGPIGSGLKAKYSINLFLVSVTTGLAESVNLARAQGLDLDAFGQVLNSCPLASAYSKIKIAKILNGDWTPQAAIKDCYNSTELIKSAAQGVQVQTPLIQILPFHIRAKGIALLIGGTSFFSQFVKLVGPKKLGWKYHIVYCVWHCVVLTTVFFMFLETKNPSLEETCEVFEKLSESPSEKMFEATNIERVEHQRSEKE